MNLKIIVSIFVVLVTIVLLMLKGGIDMSAIAVIYATLIIKGRKTISQVPLVIREQVKQVLIDLEMPELAEEN